MSLLDIVIIFLSRLLWYLGCFGRFAIDLLNNLENFISVIIINFIFYDFSLVIFVAFVDGIILSFFTLLLTAFSNTILLHYSQDYITYLMTVSFVQWCAVIDIFNCRVSVVSTKWECKTSRNFITMLEILLLHYYYLESTFISLLTLLYMLIFLQRHGDIEKNSRSKKTKKKSLSAYYWNLKSLQAHIFSILTRLKANVSIYKHNLICLSETYLHTIVPDSFLKIDGYTLTCADHLNDTERGGICIYYNGVPSS